MKSAITTSYVFTPPTRTLDLSSISGFNLALLYAVIDATAGTIIYAQGSPTLGVSSVSNGVLTLTYNTVGLNGSDELMILYEVASAGATASGQATQIAQETATAAALGTTADAAWSGSGTSSIVAALKSIWGLLSGTLKTQLQTGTAAIGSVAVSTLPALPAGSNAIGSVGVSTLPALPTGSNTVGSVGINVGGSPVAAANGVPIYDAFTAPAATTWTSATAANAAETVTTSGYDTVVVTVVPSGTITAGAVVWEVFDGATWISVKAPRTDSYQTDSSFALAGAATHAWQVPVAGFPQFRVRLSTAITGSGSVLVTTITSSAPDTSIVTVGLDPSSPLPAGTNSIGSVVPLPVSANGADASNAMPTALTVLQTFTVTQPGAYFVQNQSAAPIQVIFDNGAGGNVSIQLLAPGAGAGQQGADTTPPMPWFTGRVQVAGATGAQFLARHN